MEAAKRMPPGVHKASGIEPLPGFLDFNHLVMRFTMFDLSGKCLM